MLRKFRAILLGLIVVLLFLAMIPALTIQVHGASNTIVQVGTSSSGFPLGFDYQGKTAYADSRYWVFYSDGNNMLYTSSTNGVNWAGLTIVASAASGLFFSVWFSGSNIYYVRVDGATNEFWYNIGTLNSDGTITFGTEVGVGINGVGYGPTITTDTSGNIWIGVQEPFQNEAVFECSSSSRVPARQHPISL